MSETDRAHHLANVQARRRRAVLLAHTVRAEEDLRQERAKQAGPGVADKELDSLKLSSTRRTSHLRGSRKREAAREIRFIQTCKRQVELMHRLNTLPPPHMAIARQRKRRQSSHVMKCVHQTTSSGISSKCRSHPDLRRPLGEQSVARQPRMQPADDPKPAGTSSHSGVCEADVTRHSKQADSNINMTLNKQEDPRNKSDATERQTTSGPHVKIKERQPASRPQSKSNRSQTAVSGLGQLELLQSLKVGELRRSAKRIGVHVTAIDTALDASDPKRALIDLIVANA